MGKGTWAPRLQGLKACDSQTWGGGGQRPQTLRHKTWETGSQVLRFEASVLGAEGLESWTPGSEEEGLGAWILGLTEEGGGGGTMPKLQESQERSPRSPGWSRAVTLGLRRVEGKC